MTKRSGARVVPESPPTKSSRGRTSFAKLTASNIEAAEKLSDANPLKKALLEQNEEIKQRLHHSKPLHTQIESLRGLVSRDEKRQTSAKQEAKQAMEKYLEAKLQTEQHKAELMALERRASSSSADPGGLVLGGSTVSQLASFASHLRARPPFEASEF